MVKTDKEDDPRKVALEFVEVINAGNSRALVELQTEDFTLIDMAGDVYQGKDGWQDYFSAYPDYKIQVKHILTSGDGVAIIGKTTGSQLPPEIEEKETVLWTAEIRDGLVAEWRLYSNVDEIKSKMKNNIKEA